MTAVATKPSPLYETQEQKAARLEKLQRYQRKLDNFTEPKDRRVFLRVLIRSVAEQARAFRRKEKGFPRSHQLRAEMRLTRKNVLRPEARHCQLAMAFLKGKHSYNDIEPTARTIPDWDEVKRLVINFGAYHAPGMAEDEFVKIKMDELARLCAWCEGAPVGVKAV